MEFALFCICGVNQGLFLPFGRSCLAVARHNVEECYYLEKTMGLSPLALCFAKNLSRYFVYEAFFAWAKRQADDGRELFMYDYTMGANNNVFSRI
ncbi:MAG: hypothetical protein NC082_03995 [Clostridiales bacterium]|nr:hypothetical protein [Clostridiales bacterium]